MLLRELQFAKAAFVRLWAFPVSHRTSVSLWPTDRVPHKCNSRLFLASLSCRGNFPKKCPVYTHFLKFMDRSRRSSLGTTCKMSYDTRQPYQTWFSLNVYFLNRTQEKAVVFAPSSYLGGTGLWCLWPSLCVTHHYGVLVKRKWRASHATESINWRLTSINLGQIVLHTST